VIAEPIRRRRQPRVAVTDGAIAPACFAQSAGDKASEVFAVAAGTAFVAHATGLLRKHEELVKAP
jgi:hypothetical protein